MFRAIILGAPASGKGTISSRIVKHFDITHLSSGDLLRNQIQKSTSLGKEAETFINAGKLVPDDLMIKLVLSELESLKTKNWLLDGFPRTRPQAEILLQKHAIQIALALNVPVDVIVDRVKGRWVHVSSGRVYNESFNRPKIWGKDDITNEPLEQRPDDAPEAVRKRLKLYTETAEPLLSLYEARGILKSFSGSTSDEIWPLVKKTLADVLPPRLKL